MSKLDILFMSDGVAWTAQCLQYDVAAQGKTIKEAQNDLEYALMAEVGYLAETDRTLDDLQSAPKCFWEMYENAQELQPIARQPLRVPSRISDLINSIFPVHPGLRVA